VDWDEKRRPRRRRRIPNGRETVRGIDTMRLRQHSLRTELASLQVNDSCAVTQKTRSSEGRCGHCCPRISVIHCPLSGPPSTPGGGDGGRGERRGLGGGKKEAGREGRGSEIPVATRGDTGDGGMEGGGSEPRYVGRK